MACLQFKVTAYVKGLEEIRWRVSPKKIDVWNGENFGLEEAVRVSFVRASIDVLG